MIAALAVAVIGTVAWRLLPSLAGGDANTIGAPPISAAAPETRGDQAADAKPVAPTPAAASPDASSAAPTSAATETATTDPQVQSAPAQRDVAPVQAAQSPALALAGDLYDSFADARFDGRFDPTRWQLTSADARMRFAQRGGAMQIQSREQQHGLLAEFAGTRLRQVSAKVKLSPPLLAAQASLGVTISRADHGGAWLSCYVYATRGAEVATPVCTDQRREQFRSGAPAALDRWHEVAMRIDEHDERAIVSADGLPLGELPLAGRGSTTWYLMLSGWSADGEPVEGMVGELRVERTP